MADNVTLSAGTADGAVIATDDDGVAQHQYVKLEFGADNTQTKVAAAAPLPVQISDGTDTALVSAGGALSVAGTVDLGATDNAVLDDIAAKLGTIDADTSTLAAAVSTEMQVDVVGPLPAGTNNIGDVDVLTFPTTVHSADFDSGAGTDTTLAFGIAVPADGGAAVVPGSAADGLTVNLGTNNDVTVTGTVDLGATDNAVLDAIAASVAAIDTDATTIIGHVDGIETLLGTIDADTSSLAGAVAGTEVQVDVVAALPAGTNAIGKLAANSGVDIGDVDVLSIAAGTNSIGNVGVIPRTSGGMTAFNSIDLDETEEEIKATAGQIFSITAFNTTAAPLYLRFYNATAANTTVGTTAAALGPFVVPGNADSDGAGFVWNNPIGFAFGTAISAAVTTGVAANDTGAPGDNACIVIVGYA